MHGEGNGLSSITAVPARAAAKDIVGAETGCTVIADCTIAEEGAASNTHGHWHVYAMCGLYVIHQTGSSIETRVVQPL